MSRCIEQGSRRKELDPMAVHVALRLDVPNRPGELVKVLRPIAAAGVNLHAVAGVAASEGSRGSAGTQAEVIELLPSQVAAAVDALQQAGIHSREVEVVVTWLPNKPGALLKACEALAAAGLNLEGLYVISTDPTQGVQLTFECPEARRADQVLAGVRY
jgi:hypothetical protein